MDPHFRRMVADRTPKLNPDLANGLAVKHVPLAPAYINQVFRAVAKGFPEGLTFQSGVPCLPQDDFNELTKKRGGSKRFYDVARSDLYMMQYTFMYRGEKIIRYMSLPFVNEAGVIYLGGSRFVISPVLSDRVMSVDMNSIFIRFNRGKVTFERLPAYYRANGQQETCTVVHGKIYNRNSGKNAPPKPVIKGAHTLVHYLFCKYGVSETFARMTGNVPVFGTAEEITDLTHPKSEWVVCETIDIKPKTVTEKVWRPSTMRVAVRREHYTPTMRNYIGGFFYILDHFPIRIDRDRDFMNSPRMWRILMGHLIFGSNMGEGHLHDNVTDHIHSLDEYVDEIMRVNFAEIKVPVEDIYQFFGILIEKFDQWLTEGSDKINSLYDKQLSVLYYLLEDVTITINTFYFKLIASAQSKRDLGKDLKKEDIVDLMNKFLRPGKIYSITKQHREVSTTSTSGDNMALKITSMMVPQAKSSRGGGRSDSGAMTDPAKILHVSVAEIGGYANMPKSDPSGHSRINHHALIDAKGVVQRNPALVEILDRVQDMIRRI